MPLCDCGSGIEYESCCGPYLKGALAPTAESLMRSRYTAHVRGDVGYIKRTAEPEEGKESDPQEIAQILKNRKYLGLNILSAKDGCPGDAAGYVEYAYRFSENGRTYRQQEKGRFVCRDGAWLFEDSEVDPKSGFEPGPKTGRNDLCPCGSGKKYKKCCGA